MEGIGCIIIEDVKSVVQFGYCIKYLGIVKDIGYGIELCVYFILIFCEIMLLVVNGVMNVIMIDGDVVGLIMFYGVGVGVEFIVLVVVVDIIEMGCVLMVDYDEWVFYLGFYVDQMFDDLIFIIDDVFCSFYLCLYVQDKFGVLVNIICIFSDNYISIEVMVQKEIEEGLVLIVMMIYKVLEGDMNVVLVVIVVLDIVDNSIMCICVEMLDV